MRGREAGYDATIRGERTGFERGIEEEGGVFGVEEVVSRRAVRKIDQSDRDGAGNLASFRLVFTVSRGSVGVAFAVAVFALRGGGRVTVMVV